MMKSLKISGFIFILLINVQTQAQFRLGARAGNNLTDMTMIDIKEISGMTKIMNKSLHIGGIVQYQVSKLSDIFRLESGLLLSWKGTTVKQSYLVNGVSKSSLTKKISPIYLELPVSAIYVVDFEPTKIQFFFGPYLGYIVAGKIKIEDSPFHKNYKSEPLYGLKPLDYGMNFGAGLEMDDILLRVHYGYGLANLDPQESKNSPLRNRVLSISIGCMFGNK